MLEPRTLYDVDESAVAALLGERKPGDVGPVLLYAIAGFMDAGSAGAVAVEHLRTTFTPTRLVTFDVDLLLDYRSKRAAMTFATDRWTDYDQPFFAIDHLRDAEGTGFLLLHGAEPDLHWERVIEALLGLIDRFAVSLTVGFHGMPMGIPHTRPLSLTAHATRTELLGDHTAWFGTVRVPASLGALLEFRLGAAGHDAVGYTVHVPHYLSQATYPPAAVAALNAVERLTGLDLAVCGLSKAAREATEEVSRQVGESEEVAAVVHALEDQYDAFTRSVGRKSLLAEAGPIPTAEELGAEFERFLAQQAGE